MSRTVMGKTVIAGSAEGEALVSKIPLSFWGGVDAHSGNVVDVHHDLCGKCMTGRILLIPNGRGSCSGSGIMLEMIRQKTAPAAMISIEAESIIALGSVIGKQLYGRVVPLYTLSREDYESIQTGDQLSIREDGLITIAE